MEFLMRANKTAVTPELLGDVLKMHSDLSAEERPVHEIRMIRLFQLLEERGLKDKRGDLAIAIDFRLTALARLIASGETLGWTLPGMGPGLEFIHPHLVSAAAAEPLIEDADHDVAFDAESFRRRVFSGAGTGGV